MFKKIFKFLSGYVIIEITGKNKERFINMCMANRFTIFDVVPEGDGLELKILKRDFMKIRRLVRKCRVKVRIVEKRGLRVFMRQHRYRYGFFVSGALVISFFLTAPNYIWAVEIDGASRADTGQIERILRDYGVYVGAKKSGIGDLTKLKNAVVFNTDGVNWAWLYVEGTRARLQIQEASQAPPIHDLFTPTSIVASRDGLIVKADVKRGERRVNRGTVVNEGDVLVSGKVAVFREGTPEKYIYVHSDADIQAETVRTAYGEFSTREILRVRTGSSKKRVSAELFGKSFNMFRHFDCGYGEYDTSLTRHDFDLPFIGYTGISLCVNSVSEVKITEHILSEEEVLSRAKETLEERICRELGTGAVKYDEELTYDTDGEIYRVKLRMYLRENIGTEVPAKE